MYSTINDKKMANDTAKVNAFNTGKLLATFVHLNEPSSATPEATPKYGLNLIIEKGSEDEKKIKRAIKECYTANAKMFNNLPFEKMIKSRTFHSPLKDGDTVNEERENEGKDRIAEYVDNMFLRVTSAKQVKVVDKHKEEIIDPDEIYSGMYVRVNIKPYAFDKAGNKGIGFFLNIVQKVADGERLSGGGASADVFDDEESTEDDF